MIDDIACDEGSLILKANEHMKQNGKKETKIKEMTKGWLFVIHNEIDPRTWELQTFLSQ